MFIDQSALALNCDLAKRLHFPDVATNSRFWEDYSRVENMTDDQLKRLFEKHKISLSVSESEFNKVTSVATELNPRYTINHKIQKSVNSLPQNLKEKFSEFINEVNDKGVKSLYSNPGKWRFEKIKQNKTHTVRLNEAYRIEFVETNGVVEIIDVGKQVTH